MDRSYGSTVWNANDSVLRTNAIQRGFNTGKRFRNTLQHPQRSAKTKRDNQTPTEVRPIKQIINAALLHHWLNSSAKLETHRSFSLTGFIKQSVGT